MKKNFFTLTLFVLILGNFVASAQNWVGINNVKPSKAEVSFVSGTIDHSVVKVSINGYFTEKVATSRGEAVSISIPGAPSMLEAGNPELPYVTTSLLIPNRANMVASVVSSKFTDYANIEVAPSKGSFTRDILPSSVPYTYSKQYDVNEFYPSSQVFMQEPYILRDYRGQTLVVQPFAYNPVTKTLRVYHEVIVDVKAQGVNNVNAKDDRAIERIDREYNNIYQSQFINYASAAKYTSFVEEGDMLIISHPTFFNEMQPLVAWKNSIGRKTTLINLNEVGGTSAAQIKTYLQNRYNEHPFTYLLFVGDSQHIPAMVGSGLGGPSDIAYAYITGNDKYPEFLVGRFSVETAQHVQTMVNRTIEYEKNPYTTADWFTKGMGIASQEGPGHGGLYDHQHMRAIRTKLLAHTYTAVSELYEGSQGGLDAPGHPTPALVATDVNNGLSVINYVGHGSDSSWGTSGFSSNNVNTLTNNHKWPFIWSVACVNGEFIGKTCFAEAWTRASNAEGPTGAIGAYMSTINQLWRPPMLAQIEMNDILTEAQANNMKRTYAGISYSGSMKMIEGYANAGGPATADTWVVFGDPSLMVRTIVPTAMEVTHAQQIPMGSTSFEVNTTVNNARATLSKNGEIIATGIINNGKLSLTFDAIAEEGNITLTVYAFNRIPYIKDIPTNGDVPTCLPVTDVETAVDGNNVTVTWKKPNGDTPTEGEVTIILEAHNVWGDGTGYQLLLDAQATEYGVTIPTSGPLSQTCSVPATLYDVFEFKNPTNADPSCTSTNIVMDGIQTITIPAGTYDYCVVNPTPNQKLWIAGGALARQDNYVFESGKTYHFSLAMQGTGDNVTVVVTDRNGDVNVMTDDNYAPVNDGSQRYTAEPKYSEASSINTVERALTGYKVYREGTMIHEITDANTLTYTDNGVENGTYNYCVEAIYDEGAAPQACIEVVVDAPGDCPAVTNVQAEADGTTVNVTWTAPVMKGREVLLTENFDGTTIPTGWTQIDADGDGHMWSIKGAPGVTGHGGSGNCVTSASWEQGGVGPLNPDNYLITPLVAGANEVKYWVNAQDAAYPAEHYAVMASSTGTNAADFTIVFEETMTAKGEVGNGPRGTNVQGTWYERTVELPAGTKYVAFRHFNTTDMFWLNIDDVVISGGAPVDPDYTYTVTKDGTVVGTGLTTTSYTENNVASGTYDYCVKVVYTNPACTSAAVCDEVTVEPATGAPVTNLEGNAVDNDVTLTWTKPGDTPVEGEVTIILEANDVWGDGTGYQLLLDANASEFGVTIPVQGPLTQDCNVPATLYDVFEFKNPTNADPTCTSANVVVTGSQTITIPAGTYDFCVVNPTPNQKLWIAGGEFSRQDNYVFEANKTYRFSMAMAGTGDNTTITVTDTKGNVSVFTDENAAQNSLVDNGLHKFGKGNPNSGAKGTLTGYKVYRGSDLISTITNVNTLTYVDSGVAPGTYNYCVVATYTDGVSPQECVSVVVPNGGDCAPVTNLHLDAQGSTANLTWTAPAPAGKGREVILTEGFENGIPSTWIQIDGDNDGFMWTIEPAFQYDNVYQGHNSEKAASSVSWDAASNQALNPNNYLITPNVAGATNVTYYVGSPANASYVAEHYAVMASTTGTAAADFTVVFEETLTYVGDKSENNGRGIDRAEHAWSERSVNLPEGTKYVAFRHFDCSDKYMLRIDDVVVNGGTPNPTFTYTVTKDGAEIATGLTVTSYTDNNVTGNPEYCVKVVYPSCTSAAVCVNFTSVQNDQLSDVKVYPNPTSHILNVQGDIKGVTMYNSLGQVVKAAMFNNQINVSTLTSGVYYLVINTNDGKQVTEKVVITK